MFLTFVLDGDCGDIIVDLAVSACVRRASEENGELVCVECNTEEEEIETPQSPQLGGGKIEAEGLICRPVRRRSFHSERTSQCVWLWG